MRLSVKNLIERLKYIPAIAGWSVLVIVLLQAVNVPAQTGKFADLKTHRLFYVGEGKGAPAVVIDAGIAGRLEEWASIRDRIAEKTRIIVYDRAGYGRSTAGPLPRDSKRAADELKQLLEAASVPGPYLLVGHSLGGLNVQVFAGHYPNKVAGLVLLDPPPLGWLLDDSYPDLREMAEGMTDEWQTLAERDKGSEDPEQRRQADFFLTIASEHREMFSNSAKQASAIESFGPLPLVVMAAGQANPMFGDVAGEYQQYWIDQSRRLAGKSPNGKFVLARDSSHRLHLEAEDLVVEVILSMLAGLKAAPDSATSSRP